jgi:hypothetical protein
MDEAGIEEKIWFFLTTPDSRIICEVLANDSRLPSDKFQWMPSVSCKALGSA